MSQERDLSLFRSLFGKITFVPTLALNVALEKLSARQWYSRIDQHVILGALPWKSITQELVDKENVRGVVSMNMDYELFSAVADKTHWEQMGVRFLQLRTADIFHSPTLDKLNQGVEFINKIAAEGNTVYVHCKAGRTRSATLVGCYLINKHKFTPKEAESYMKERRSHIFLHQKQRDSLEAYHNQHIGNNNDTRSS